MPLFHIAGASGSGKSTVCLALRERGYLTYDTDEDALARWQHRETGFIHPKSSVKPHQRTPEFMAQHDWNVPRETIERLIAEANGKALFICGVMSNAKALSDLVDVTVALYVDPDTVAKRLTERPGETHWGKRPEELAETLRIYQSVYDDLRERGAIFIDATQPIDGVVDETLRLTAQKFVGSQSDQV